MSAEPTEHVILEMAYRLTAMTNEEKRGKLQKLLMYTINSAHTGTTFFNDISQYSYLSWETTEEAIPEVYQREGKVLVEEIAQEITHAEVGPASVHQQEPPQEPKLSKRVIWCQNRLHPLLTADADTDVSSWGRNTQYFPLKLSIK